MQTLDEWKAVLSKDLFELKQALGLDEAHKHTKQRSDPSKKSESKRRPCRSLPQGSLRVTHHSAEASSRVPSMQSLHV
jgi:hypothetical protein